MITRVKRKKIDIEKYNSCIENSMQSNIYGFSWYLDIFCDHWDVLVLNDYEAVMPIPWRRKFFIKYVYPPFWLIQLGIYSVEVEDENEFLIELFGSFKYVETRTNENNSFSMFHPYQKYKELQFLNLNIGSEAIQLKYKKDRKKDLQRAKKNDLTEKWNDEPEKLIELYKNNVGKRIRKIKDKDYEVLLKLIKVCIEKNKGEVLSIYDSKYKLVASGFFLKHSNRVTILASSTDFKNRRNGANTFLINSAIYKYQNSVEIFDFGGSSMKKIAQYFLSFGAETENFFSLKYNVLPWVIRLFKR